MRGLVISLAQLALINTSLWHCCWWSNYRPLLFVHCMWNKFDCYNTPFMNR